MIFMVTITNHRYFDTFAMITHRSLYWTWIHSQSRLFRGALV